MRLALVIVLILIRANVVLASSGEEKGSGRKGVGSLFSGYLNSWIILQHA